MACYVISQQFFLRSMFSQSTLQCEFELFDGNRGPTFSVIHNSCRNRFHDKFAFKKDFFHRLTCRFSSDPKAPMSWSSFTVHVQWQHNRNSNSLLWRVKTQDQVIGTVYSNPHSSLLVVSVAIIREKFHFHVGRGEIFIKCISIVPAWGAGWSRRAVWFYYRVSISKMPAIYNGNRGTV